MFERWSYPGRNRNRGRCLRMDDFFMLWVGYIALGTALLYWVSFCSKYMFQCILDIQELIKRIKRKGR